jgi:hypothetical protein
MRAARISDSGTGLLVELVVERMRQVNAPEMPPIILGERLEYDSTADPVGHACLDHSGRPEVAYATPYRAAQLDIGVAVPAICMTARPKPFRGQQRVDLRQ